MGKSVRTPIVAAGGIVIRTGARPLVAVVQRRRDNAWVLPKGKLKPNEKPVAAARREAIEETGSDVRVYEYLGVISYVGGSGPKVAHFWRMQAVGAPAGKPMDDVGGRMVAVIHGDRALRNLAHEQSFLRNVGRKALRRSLRKTRTKPRSEEVALAADDVVAAIKEKAPASADKTTPITPPNSTAPHRTQAGEAATALACYPAPDQTLAIRGRADSVLTADAGRRAYLLLVTLPRHPAAIRNRGMMPASIVALRARDLVPVRPSCPPSAIALCLPAADEAGIWTRDHTFVKVAAADTGGAYALMEDNLKREFALGLHLHRQHAETFYILDSPVNFHIDGDWMEAAPGACVHIPPGVPHALDLPAGGTGRCLMIFQPAGFDQFLEALAGLSEAQLADDALMAALNEKYDIINLGDVPPRA